MSTLTRAAWSYNQNTVKFTVWLPALFCSYDQELSIFWFPLCNAQLSHNADIIGHVNSIPTMQFFSGISINTQSKSYMLSLT